MPVVPHPDSQGRRKAGVGTAKARKCVPDWDPVLLCHFQLITAVWPNINSTLSSYSSSFVSLQQELPFDYLWVTYDRTRLLF